MCYGLDEKIRLYLYIFLDPYEREMTEPDQPRKRGNLHSRVNQRRAQDRMNEGKFGSHISRSVYTQATEQEAIQRG